LGRVIFIYSVLLEIHDYIKLVFQFAYCQCLEDHLLVIRVPYYRRFARTASALYRRIQKGKRQLAS
jgi:hypothetical protein